MSNEHSTTGHIDATATPVIVTERLVLRQVSLGDAAFFVRVLNDPAFMRFVGDRQVRTIEQAQAFLEKGPLESYRRHGFGHYVVTLKRDRTPIGICGFVKRDALEDVDIGYSFLPEYRSQGYAREAVSAVMDYGARTLGFRRIVAIVSPGNDRSIRLLGTLGLTFERMVKLSEDGQALELHGWRAGD